MIMKSTAIMLVGLLVLGTASYAISHFYLVANGPTLQVPATVDLGRQQLGRRLSATFPLKNVGRETLIVDDLSSSCGCIQLQVVLKDKSQEGQGERT